MESGLETTFRVLTQTGSSAADRLLISALDSPDRTIQEGALQALLGRRTSDGPMEILRRWPQLSLRWKSLIARRPGRCSPAIREAVGSVETERCANGCAAGLALCEYELMPILVPAVEDRASPHRQQMLDTLMGLVESLYDELASPRDYRIRRDPHQVRQHLLSALENSLGRFYQHRTPEIVEAFLMLVNRDHCGFKRILQSPHDPTHAIIIERMTASPRPGVMRLVLSCLDDPQPMRAAVNVLVRRRDIPFVRHLLKKITADLDAVLKSNLKRIDNVTWLHDPQQNFATFSDREQAAIVRFAMAINSGREANLEVLHRMLAQGKPSGRAAAAIAMAEFRGEDANELFSEALNEDPDPAVRANLLLQLRDRGIAGAIDRLTYELDSPHDVIRAAAQRGLSDFSFARYLSAFEKLDDEVQVSTGRMVVKIDPSAVAELQQELASEVRTRRLRAIAMTIAMGCALDVEKSLRLLLSDPDHYVRAMAVNAISNCDTPTARESLHAALRDNNATVRDAAAEALKGLESNRADPPSNPVAFAPASSSIESFTHNAVEA